MVRFIIRMLFVFLELLYRFTFQYGQIYYVKIKNKLMVKPKIYIPIWLDLLFNQKRHKYSRQIYLHSNMVRFIMKWTPTHIEKTRPFTFQYGQIYYYYKQAKLLSKNHIYIPIWLDLLQFTNLWRIRKCQNLHSNMVRFIITTNEY